MIKRTSFICLLVLATLGCDEQFQSDHYFNKNLIGNVSQGLELAPLTGIIQINNSVSDFINNSSGDEKLEVSLVFDGRIQIPRMTYTYHSIKTNDGEKMYLNGKEMNEDDLIWLNNNILSERKSAVEATKALRTEIIRELKELGIEIEKETETEYINGYNSLNLSLNKDELLIVQNHKKLIGIELYQSFAENSIETAKNATYVTQGANFTYNREGTGVGIYMSEGGCPPTSYLTNYQRLGTSSDSDHSRRVSSIIRSVSPNSTIYCRGGFSYPTADDIEDDVHTPPIFIANLSFGHSSQTYDDKDQLVDDVSYNNGISIVVSAGNNGNGDGYVLSPGHGLNVITVGNYDDHDNTASLFEIRSTSSYKDATDTRNSKPELSAPGTRISFTDRYKISGGLLDCNSQETDCSGTSFSAPHVAGMLANMNSRWSTPSYAAFTPAMAKSLALQGATDYVIGGSDRVGYAGIDFNRLYNNYAMWWHKGNYDTIAAADNYPNNGAIDDYLTLSATSHKARVVFAWLNSGTWTYNHRNNLYPMGTTFQFKVFSPNGTLLKSVQEYYNGYAVLEFDVNTTGNYHFYIKRLHNNDTSASLNMAVTVWK